MFGLRAVRIQYVLKIFASQDVEIYLEILRRADCTWPKLPGLDAFHTTEHSQLAQYASRLERQVAELQNRLQSQNESCTQEVAPQSISPVNNHGELSTDVVLLSMNAAAEPSFIGATSGFSLSRLVEGILSESILTRRVRDNETTVSGQIPMREQSSVATDQEDVLVDTFFQRVHPRYPLLDEASLQNVFRQSTRDDNHNTPDLFILYMVYAIAARTIQLHPEMRQCTSPEVCYATGSPEKIFNSKTRLDILYTCPAPYRFGFSEPEPGTDPSPPFNCPLSSPNSQ